MNKLLQSEEGAANSLGFVMTMPLLILLICLLVETTLLLAVKVGTIYAAYAAARSGVVWRTTSRVPLRADSVSRRAAVQALVPFAAEYSGARPSRNATAYTQAIAKSSDNSRASELARSYAYAEKATRVSLHERPGGQLEAIVEFEAPLRTPVFAQLLGRRSSWRAGYGYRIRSSVTLPLERAHTKSGNLGIAYEPQ